MATRTRSAHGRRRRRRTVVLGVVVASSLLLATAAAAQDVPPLPGTATTEPSEQASDTEELLTVVDVRVGTHDGFDRVTFETAGEGQVGWFIEYEDDPVSDGSGLPIEVEGAATLRVVLREIALPPDATAETFLDDVAGPAGGIVTEVVNDSIFEGHHTFVVGLDERVPYRVGLLEDPNRLVVDLVHDGVPTSVDAGDGGAAARSTPPLAAALTMVAGLALVVVGSVRRLRRPVT